MAVKFPNGEDMAHAVGVAGSSPRAIAYLRQELAHLADKHHIDLPPVQTVLKDLQALESSAEKTEVNTTSVWEGKPLQSLNLMQAMQASIAEAARMDIQSEMPDKNVVHDFAINDEGEFVRAFSDEEGNSLGSKVTEGIDKQFNQWLAERGYLSQGSCIYQQDEQGEILEKDGKPVKADPAQVEKQLTDSRQGFGRFMQDQGIKLQSTVRPYPQEAVSPTGGS